MNMPMNIVKPVAGLLFTFGLAACATPPPQTNDAMTNLIDLSYQRLGLADAAGRAKWDDHKPVIDEAHEKVAVDTFVNRAPAAGVDPVFARAFFSELIDGVNSIEYGDYKQWKLAAPTGAPPDLLNVVRPAQARIEGLLMPALAQVQPLRAAPDCSALLTQSLAAWKAKPGFDQHRSQGLDMALANVCGGGKHA
jgi:chorismate mutase